ncbi:MAG: class I SAM-dependent methyltransferase [Halobacterium sp.]
MDDWQDDAALADQYADASNLAARQVLHARFATAEQSRHEWMFDQFDLPDEASVLSLGAGHGALWAANDDRIPSEWDVTVTDASSGMMMDAMESLEECSHDFNFDAVDASDVPYPDDAFDAVTAHHVLYHLGDADRDRAIAEVRRVLKPGGTFYASTDGAENLREVFDVVDEFGDHPGELAFNLENGAGQLREHFDDVELRRFEDSLHVTAHEPLVAYVLSLPGVDEDVTFDVAERFRELVGEDGLDVTKDVGVFVASG